MKKKKKYLVTIILVSLLLCACQNSEQVNLSETSLPMQITVFPSASYDYLTFDEAIVKYATDIVVAQYVSSRPFGETLIEFEFIVSDRILGDAKDRIFVYFNTFISSEVVSMNNETRHIPKELRLKEGVNYLVPLMRIIHPHANTHDDGYVFIRNIVVNLDQINESTMYGEPLSQHTTGFVINNRTSKDAFIEYVESLTVENETIPGMIKSTDLEVIVNASPYILLIEIAEPLRLSHEQVFHDWWSDDLYYVDIIYSFKGNTHSDHDIVVSFAPDTVFTGDRVIVAVDRISKGSSWFRFTSTNSLISEQLSEEIISILTAN